MESFKKLNVTNIFSKLFIISVFVLFCFLMSWLCLVLKRSIIHYHSKPLPQLPGKRFSPKLRERRLLRLDLGHKKNQWRAQSPSEEEGRSWGPGCSHTQEKRNLHEPIPKCQPSVRALHTHTYTHTHQPCLPCLRTRTLGLQILIKSTKAAAIGQFEELIL